MAILRATAVLNKRSGKPEDAARNVWHFSKNDQFTTSEVTDVGNAVGGFYTGLSNWLAPSLSPTALAHRVELADVTPGVAGEDDDVISSLRGTTQFTCAPSTANLPMPNEVAVCLSFAGDLDGVPEEQGLIRPAARRRGRVYLGPVNASILGIRDTTGYEPEIVDNAKEAILDAYQGLINSLFASHMDIRHVIYSRAEAMTRVVQMIRVNDEFDNVRRRGIKPATRFWRSIVQGANTALGTGTEEVIIY